MDLKTKEKLGFLKHEDPRANQLRKHIYRHIGGVIVGLDQMSQS